MKMKYIKLFEEYVAVYEAKKSISPEAVDKLQQLAQEYLKITYDAETMYQDVDKERIVLKSQIQSAHANGNDQEAKKLEKRKEDLNPKYDKIETETLKRIRFKTDAEKDPEIKKIIKNIGNIFDKMTELAKAQAQANQTEKYIAALKKIDQKNLTDKQKDQIQHYINVQLSYKDDLQSAQKNANDIFAKLKDLKENPGSASTKKEKKITKAQVDELLEVSYEKLTVKPDEISVVVSGNKLGYDDDQYYETVWYISDKRVETAVYGDKGLKDQITADVLSGEVDSLEAFASIVNKGGE